MKNFIIWLPAHPNSRLKMMRARDSAEEHGWKVNLWAGIDGRKVKLKDLNITVSTISKKAYTYMQRPGTAGCLMSHWKLWNECIRLNEPIAIFEHDVIFKKPIGDVPDCDVYKFEGFKKAKPISIGNWYEGARAYVITPKGANKLISWIRENGALPADWMLCDGIVDMKFDNQERVIYKDDNFSFTKDLR